MDLDRARHLLDKGIAHLEAGRHRRAMSALGKGVDAMSGGERPDADGVKVLAALADALQRACEGAGKEAAWRERLATIFDAGLHKGPAAEQFMTRLAIEEKRADEQAIDAYITYLEGRGRVGEELRVTLNQVLSYALHIRLTTPIEQARMHVPRLERLHRARPKLTFPRLYLGRYFYLERDYARARDLLAPISGRLSESPKVLNVRARCAEKLDAVDEALELYRLSLSKDRHQPHVHFRIGRLLLGAYRRAAGLDSSLATEPRP